MEATSGIDPEYADLQSDAGSLRRSEQCLLSNDGTEKQTDRFRPYFRHSPEAVTAILARNADCHIWTELYKCRHDMATVIAADCGARVARQRDDITTTA